MLWFTYMKNLWRSGKRFGTGYYCKLLEIDITLKFISDAIYIHLTKSFIYDMNFKVLPTISFARLQHLSSTEMKFHNVLTTVDPRLQIDGITKNPWVIPTFCIVATNSVLQKVKTSIFSDVRKHRTLELVR